VKEADEKSSFDEDKLSAKALNSKKKKTSKKKIMIFKEILKDD
jgi:hypothetical protein